MSAGVGSVTFFFPFGFSPNSRTISEGIAEPRVMSVGKTLFSEKTKISFPSSIPRHRIGCQALFLHSADETCCCFSVRNLAKDTSSHLSWAVD